MVKESHSIIELKNKTILVSLPKKVLGARKLTKKANHQIEIGFKTKSGVKLLKTCRTNLLVRKNMKKIVEDVGTKYRKKAKLSAQKTEYVMSLIV